MNQELDIQKIENTIKDSILKGIDNNTIESCKKFGHYLATTDPYDMGKKIKTKMTTSQLRKFFGEIKRIQVENSNNKNFNIIKKSIVLLKPKLAYAVGRSHDNKPNNKITDFYNVISTAIDQVDNHEKFENLVQIIEAIVAFHKEKEGGK